MKKHFIRISIVLFIITGITKGFAQDSNFWTQQYGTRSTLLGGAVIGSVEDLGAVYYNPGLFSTLENPGFLLSAKVYMNSNATIEDGAGEGVDLKKSSFGGAPGLVAGAFKLGFAPGHKFGYSILTRQRGGASFTTREGDTLDVIPNWPDEELFGGELRFTQKLDDVWAGLTWAYPFSDKIGLGLTQFLSIRSQSLSTRIFLEALGTMGQTASVMEIDEFNYKTYGTLTKVGIGLTLPQFTAGLTVTTPMLNISGSGTTLFNDLTSGGDLTGDGNSDDYLVARLQQGISAQSHTPWAIGFGTGFMIAKRLRLHLSAEWFDKINKYKILETVPWTGQSTGELTGHDIVFQTKSVFNYGAGFELFTSSKFTWYGSYVKDFSGVPDDLSLGEFESTTTLSAMDFTHIAGGTTFAVGQSEFTLGLSWATGDQEVPRLIDFEPEDPDDTIRDTDATSTLKVSRLKFIFGFSLSF